MLQEQLARLWVERLEDACAADVDEHELPGGCRGTPDHRERLLLLPTDLAAVDVDRGECAGALDEPHLACIQAGGAALHRCWLRARGASQWSI